MVFGDIDLAASTAPISSPKRKEPINDDRVLGIEDLRLLLKEERPTLWSTLEKFHGELRTVSGQVGKLQTTVEDAVQDRELDKEKLSAAWEAHERTRIPFDYPRI